MLKLDHTSVDGWEATVRGMRNPMNSWAKSDSHYCWEPQTATGGCFNCELNSDRNCRVDKYILGEQDKALMMKLAKGGDVHGKFLRMITVTVDVTAPLYWWKEFDTYKVGTVANSCSTMHKIHAKAFTLDDFSREHLIKDVDEAGSQIVDQHGNDTALYVTPVSLLKLTVDCLNNYRKRFLETQDKKWWWQMIQLLPSSYNQKRTVLLNYSVLRNIYQYRKNHKLDEWHTFCAWIERLPYHELITDTLPGKADNV